MWRVDPILPASLCESLIEEIDRVNPAPVVTSLSFRDQDRLIRDDPTLATRLFSLLEPHIPKTIGPLSLIGLNERLRLYRYRPGQRFTPHMDHWYQPTLTVTSLLTVLVYLNDDFEGGQTRFMEQLDEVVEPERGAAVLFQHKIRHEGCEVRRGKKYALRTDVMYRAPGALVVEF